MKKVNLETYYDPELMMNWIDTTNTPGDYDGLVSWVETDLGLILEPIGTSQDGDYTLYGTGVGSVTNPTIVIIANQHGWERGGSHYGAEFMRRMKNQLFLHTENNILLSKFHYYFVLSANPYGYQYGHNNNARDININRNYDYNFANGGQGVEPFSESETKALRDLILDKKPIAVIDIHQRGGGVKTGYGIGVDTSAHRVWLHDMINSIRISDLNFGVEEFGINTNQTLRNWASTISSPDGTGVLSLILETKNASWEEGVDRQKLKTYYGINSLLIMSKYIDFWYRKRRLIFN